MSFKIHWMFIKMKYASRMAYRLDFLMSIVAFFLFQFIGPAIIGIIYYAGGEFPGWTMPQVLLIMGSLALVRGFSFMFYVGILWATMRHVERGTLELLFIRPINKLWMLMMDSFDEEDIGQLIAGLALTLIALSLVDVHGSWLLYFVFLFFGLIFFLSIGLLGSAATVLWVKTRRLYEIIDIFMIFASYPKTIYSKEISLLFTTVLPLFILGFYPASALLGFAIDNAVLCIVSVTIFFAISLYLWNAAFKKYSGAGG